MIDPITIFAACKAAHAGIRECIDLYQDFKKDGKDVGDIVNDIGGHLGAFFTHQESFKEAEKEAKNNPLPKNISINEEAMNRILRQQQIEQMETELREMIIYQVGMPGLWSKFTEMREIVKKEREKVEREQKKPWSWLLSKNGSLFKNGKLGLRLQLVCLHGYLYLPYSCMAFT
jgi:hypothetical protein